MRDRTAGAVLRNQIIRRERGQGNIHFPCSADHEEVAYVALHDIHTYKYILVQEMNRVQQSIFDTI